MSPTWILFLCRSKSWPGWTGSSLMMMGATPSNLVIYLSLIQPDILEIRVTPITLRISKNVKTIFVSYREVLKIHEKSEKESFFRLWRLNFFLKLRHCNTKVSLTSGSSFKTDRLASSQNFRILFPIHLVCFVVIYNLHFSECLKNLWKTTWKTWIPSDRPLRRPFRNSMSSSHRGKLMIYKQ